MTLKLTDKKRIKRLLKTKIDYSAKFTFPKIIIYQKNSKSKNENKFISKPNEKFKTYKCKKPHRILPLIKSELKLYKIKINDKLDIFLLDNENNLKNFTELKTIPKSLTIIYEPNENKIKLIGAGAIGNWMPIPKSDKIFNTMYSRTGNKTMAEYMVKNKIKTNYHYEKNNGTK